MVLADAERWWHLGASGYRLGTARGERAALRAGGDFGRLPLDRRQPLSPAWRRLFAICSTVLTAIDAVNMGAAGMGATGCGIAIGGGAAAGIKGGDATRGIIGMSGVGAG